MADSFGISEAQLLALFLSSVLYGMLLITSAYCLRYLLWDGLVLLALCTFDVALVLMRTTQAFIFYTGPGGSAAEFTGLTDWVNILESCNVALGKLISDAILVYRCWIISNRSITLITFPVLLWLGEIVIAIFLIFLEAILLTEVTEIQVVITAACAISLVNNIITTGFIVHRIWIVEKENSLYATQTRAASGAHFPDLFRRSAHRKTRLQRVIRIIIESGLLYTATDFITFITFLVRSNSFYAISDVELQILSIAFNLIIIRVNTQPSESESYTIQSHLTFPLRFSATTNPSTALDTASASSTKMNSLSGSRSSDEVLQNGSLLDP
ncbi:hypothetical protein BDP27DRAFT_1327963 [Rhodocollybia butyracea]|uniref:Uncharacterized protein n=1 Tax=Rhodocollybia butyracea TaxID=206335 RepID=A0A9P5U6L5_9AGAR|nr:hypothetical protein BDP27DRAFT_1327963 [Rhodocollybia butyracea]